MVRVDPIAHEFSNPRSFLSPEPPELHWVCGFSSHDSFDGAELSQPIAPSSSGIASASVPSPLTLATEGASVSGVVTVTDLAGNSATFTSPTVKIDKTAPTLTYGAATPAATADFRE